MKTSIFIVLIFFIVISSAFAEDAPRVYTDSDLQQYRSSGDSSDRDYQDKKEERTQYYQDKSEDRNQYYKDKKEAMEEMNKRQKKCRDDAESKLFWCPTKGHSACVSQWTAAYRNCNKTYTKFGEDDERASAAEARARDAESQLIIEQNTPKTYWDSGSRRQIYCPPGGGFCN